MKKHITILSVSLILALFLTPAYSLTLTPQLPGGLTTDYGPRKPPVNGASWFHKGIDYAGSEGSGLYPVESGSIEGIAYGGGWYIIIHVNDSLLGNRFWTYLHIFNGTGSLPVYSNNWELRNATLVDPQTGEVRKSNIVVQWYDPSSLLATKVLSIDTYDGWWVLLTNNNYDQIYGENGSDPITAKGVNVKTTEVIATVGTSGIGTGAHLHLVLSDDSGNSDNPLYYIQHNDGAFSFSVQEPSQTSLSLESWKASPKVNVRINSTGGFDLNKEKNKGSGLHNS